MLKKLKDWGHYLDRKLLKPMLRQYRTPNYLARSTAIGMSLAFAPIPGQIPVTAALWLFLRRTKWRFSLAISVAWTFISNVFTNLPLFYLYYKTGDFLRDRKDSLSYHQLKKVFDDGMFNGLKFMVGELGSSILLGSLLFMMIFAIVGYFLGYGTALYHRRLELQTN